MFSRTNITLENCTQELARQIAGMPGLPGERPIRATRLAYLANLRRTHRFVAPSWAIVVDTTTGARYRANGQHSSLMLAECPPEEFPQGLLCTIDEYSTDNFDADASEIFEIFDNPRSARSNTDKMSTVRARFAELQEIKLELLVAIVNGVAHYEGTREGGVVRTPRQRGMYLNAPDVRTFAIWAASHEHARHNWLFWKPGVVSEMFTDLQTDPDAAKAFWDLTLTESHPDPEHETRECSRNLKELAPRPRVGQDRLQKEAAKFWRRYRRGLQAIAA
jgi:hypothetical protein